MQMRLILLSTLLTACIPDVDNELAIDNDGDGFTELEGDCDDYNYLTYPGAAELDSTTKCLQDNDQDGYGDQNPREGVESGTDCDDDNVDSTNMEIDADCDEVPNTDDCDETDPNSTLIFEDADCDGILTEDDCDDQNPNSTSNLWDQDCAATTLMMIVMN